MSFNYAWPEQLVLRVDERSLRGLAKLRRGSGSLPVYVPYTTPELTKSALTRAAALTRNLNAHIILYGTQDLPGAGLGALKQKLSGVAREAGVQADIRIECGHDACSASNSIFVIATKKRWWPTAEVKLARALARAGHSVALLGS